METIAAAKALAALAQGKRLSLFRLLVQAGEGGLPAGEVAKSLGVPNATLSFHVKELVNAGLVTARQEGRFIYYKADYAAMNAVVAFLTENCCGGQPCGPPTDCCAAPTHIESIHEETTP